MALPFGAAQGERVRAGTLHPRLLRRPDSIGTPLSGHGGEYSGGYSSRSSLPHGRDNWVGQYTRPNRAYRIGHRDRFVASSGMPAEVPRKDEETTPGYASFDGLRMALPFGAAQGERVRVGTLHPRLLRRPDSIGTPLSGHGGGIFWRILLTLVSPSRARELGGPIYKNQTGHTASAIEIASSPPQACLRRVLAKTRENRREGGQSLPRLPQLAGVAGASFAMKCRGAM